MVENSHDAFCTGNLDAVIKGGECVLQNQGRRKDTATDQVPGVAQPTGEVNEYGHASNRKQ